MGERGSTVPDATVRFWDRIADRYARTPVPDEAAYQEKLERTRALLDPDMDVLEIGCGTGSTALAHAAGVRRILAIDVSPRMVEIARGKAEAAGVENVEFHRAGIDDLDIEEGAYDIVMAHSILHLLPDLAGVFAKVRQALRPGGVFVSSTTCLGDRMPFFKVLGPIGRWLGLLPYINVFKTADLRVALVGAGFEVEQQWRPAKGQAVFIVARVAR